LLEESVKQDWPPHQLLSAVMRHELDERESRRIRTSLRLSGLPPGLTLGGFDFSFQPSISQTRIETLATCS
jgi:DNA replication protein DnaC